MPDSGVVAVESVIKNQFRIVGGIGAKHRPDIDSPGKRYLLKHGPSGGGKEQAHLVGRGWVHIPVDMADPPVGRVANHAQGTASRPASSGLLSLIHGKTVPVKIRASPSGKSHA